MDTPSTQSPSTTTVVANVLIIGTGAAGTRAAIAATDAGREVVVVGKRPPRDAHTVLAAGGINAALGTVDPEDTWQQHFADTMREAYMLSDPEAVEILCREAPDAVAELDAWGASFARTEDGELDQRYFGAHRYRRTCYAGDYTGRAILYALHDAAAERDIRIDEDVYVTRLLVAEGTCFGAYAFNVTSGQRTVYLADSVVLAAGGHTRLWRRSSSRRDENTGDAMGLALQAGCAVADMELVQFHPTGMVWPEEVSGTLVTEAVRGEGGRLFNADGERYMERYDAERMELSTRDRVALANYTEIMEGRGTEHGGVLLDISHVDRDTIIEKLPRMHRMFLETQMLDISTDPVEVAPTAHYSMGGVVVEPETHATDVDGLYAAGECTAGVHGANRLGGNSLAETVVFGRRAGEAASARSEALELVRRDKDVIAAAAQELDDLIGEGTELARPLQRAIRDAMTDRCGVVRDESGLRKGLEALDDVARKVPQVDVRPTSEGWGDLALALDLRGSLLSARATLMGALARTETRGCHVRSDHPEMDDEHQLVNHVVRLDADGELQLSTRPVPPVREELAEWLAGTDDYQVEGRLLE
jgi:succinate dehydrogenase / fumarate reductase, flavoprotein subunit